MTTLADDELRALIALLSLTRSGPKRVRALISVMPPTGVVSSLRRRLLPPMQVPESVRISDSVCFDWFNDIDRKLDGVDLEAHRAPGHHILDPGDVNWPFTNDPDPPLLLFVRGDPGLLDHSDRVAVIGTRRCTSVGRQVAGVLGADLAAAGVAVVSGLALGVDGAAHRGALASGGSAIGVVASGLDTVYPKTNGELWEQVATEGLLVSEVPLGQRPTRWRFPARNRLIAALSQLVVVVESHAKGGALSTVDEAMERSVPVAVVPGSTLSSASDGTNALLFDGAMPVRNGADVLLAMGLSHRPAASASSASGQMTLTLGDLSDIERSVLDAVRGGTVHIDRIIELLAASPPAVGEVVERLAGRGLLEIRGHAVSAVPQ